PGTGGSTGGREGIRSRIGIRIDVPAALLTETLELIEILDGVHPSQSIDVRLRRRNICDGIVEMEVSYPIHH
ncbi:MAG: hypothetical protein WAL61_15935, partial [Acidimicrobiales bacterium]